MTTTTQPSLIAVELLSRFPIQRFSIYIHIQIEITGGVSAEILQLLDSAIDGRTVDAQKFQRSYGLFWLWVLGVYEITRTMSEYKTCFSARLNGDVLAFKQTISAIRMPFAKLQFQNSKGQPRDVPINNEASVSGFDTSSKDISFTISGKTFWIRSTLSEFEKLVRSIEPKDVLKDQRDAP